MSFSRATLLPDYLRGRVKVLDAYVLKVGCAPLPVRGTLECNNNGVLFEINNQELFGRRLLPVLRELHECLRRSPNVTHVWPDEFIEVPKGTSLSGLTRSVSLSDPIRVAVTLPARRRAELFAGGDVVPDSFTLYFDGTLFAACARFTDSVQSMWLGQVAREYLRETLSSATTWDNVRIVAPTPLDSSVYLVAIEPNEQDTQIAEPLPSVIAVHDGVVVPFVSGLSVDEAVRAIWRELHVAVGTFYDAAYVANDVDSQVIALNNHNARLAGLMDEFFKRNRIVVIMTRQSAKIRQVLSEMHGRLHAIATSKLELATWRKLASDRIKESWLFSSIAAYASENTCEHFPFDRDAQLKLMEYAAAETNNFAVVQATLWAGVVGAFIGGAVALLTR